MFASPVSITVANAAIALQAGLAAISGGESRFDLSALKTLDSAAVATLLAWQRAARKLGKTLEFLNLPENLHSLMHMYGVAEILLSPGSSSTPSSAAHSAAASASSVIHPAEFGRH